MSIRLYVGNLPKEEIDRQELQAVFAEMGDAVSTKVIKDRKTGKCRGFGFVTVKTDEQADELIEKFNGHSFKDSPLKIEKALPRAKGQGEDDAPRPAAPTTKPAPVASSGGNASSGNSSGGGGGRRNSNKKTKRSASSSSSSSDSEGFQPDPRWAGELAKLKELLAAQASNS
jgi:RNA recognition motif-containing protein